MFLSQKLNEIFHLKMIKMIFSIKPIFRLVDWVICHYCVSFRSVNILLGFSDRVNIHPSLKKIKYSIFIGASLSNCREICKSIGEFRSVLYEWGTSRVLEWAGYWILEWDSCYLSFYFLAITISQGLKGLRMFNIMVVIWWLLLNVLFVDVYRRFIFIFFVIK